MVAGLTVIRHGASAESAKLLVLLAVRSERSWAAIVWRRDAYLSDRQPMRAAPAR